MRRTAQEILARAKGAWAQKAQWWGLCSEAYWLAAPGMDPYQSGPAGPAGQRWSAGTARHDHLFDSTLADAADKLGNQLASQMFPAGRHWAQLRDGPALRAQEPSDTKRARRMQAAEQKIFHAIHAANFSLAVHALCFDAVVSGTGLMKVGVARDAGMLLDFEPVNQADVAFERGPGGQIRAYHRKLWLTRDEVQELWPEATALPEDRGGKEGEPQRHTVCEITYYDSDPTSGEWHYEVLLEEDARPRVLWHRTYAVCPWIAYRYRLLAGEVQGRGPVFAAIPAARTAQESVRIDLEAGSIRATGAYTYAGAHTFNPKTVAFRGTTFIPVGSNARDNPTLRALELAGDPQLNRILLAEQRSEIRQIMLDWEMPEAGAAPHSATEWLQRQRRALERLGSPYMRLAEEVGRPVLRIVAYLLSELGELPELSQVAGTLPARDGAPARPAPLKLDGTDVEVEFYSPMTQAQALADLETIAQWGEVNLRIAGQRSWEIGAKTERLPRHTGGLLGVDADLYRDEEEAAELQQQAMTADLAAGGGQGAPAPGPPPMGGPM